MEANHKYLYRDLLDQYYRCLESINNSFGALSAARAELSWHQSKLSEGQNLVKSFGLFSDQEIKNLSAVQVSQERTSRREFENKLLKSLGLFPDQENENLPTVQISQERTSRREVENIFTSINRTFNEINEIDRLIVQHNQSIDKSSDSIGRRNTLNNEATNKLEELANRKLTWTVIAVLSGIPTLILCIMILGSIIDLFANFGPLKFIAGVIGLVIVALFNMIPGTLFVTSMGKLKEIENERNKLEETINTYKSDNRNSASEIEDDKNRISQEKENLKNDKKTLLELLSELSMITKSIDKFKNEKEKEFQRVWDKQIAQIKEIMGLIETSDSPDVPPRLLTLNWDDPLWTPSENDPTHWQPQISGLAPDIVRIGEFDLEYDNKRAKVPALLPIRDFSKELTNYTSGHIAFYSEDTSSRQTALLAVQSIAFRIISSFPVRKFKGVFIDPVSMGDTFLFKNLHNFITGQKTYTRTDDIREQLRSLTEHIEQVNQNYLSKNYNTIEDYNADAEAIAEPYRYLFIADFPTGFDQRSLEDLKSIILNGPKAGVYVVLHIDQTLEKPKNFDYQAINSFCTMVRFCLTLGELPQEGRTYLGYVTELTDKGVFVEFLPSITGFVPYSDLKVIKTANNSEPKIIGGAQAECGDKTVVRVESIRDDLIRLNSLNIPAEQWGIAYQTQDFRSSLNKKPKLSFKSKLPSVGNNLVFDIELDQPPSNDLFNQMAEAINQCIRNVRVDTVAFSRLYPDQDWSADSRKEIRAPIGLMGAMDKLEFWFGENQDSQTVSHGLLAGVTRSGKSFTLHAIVLSLAMQYSPHELELYLLDFKEGVEFQIYVDHEKGKKNNSLENLESGNELNENNALPHAKVISIESDREFGLSVLEYVNQQIEERANFFREKGNIPKLQDYRDVTGEKLPRILVVIDEFQRMFEEQDDITNRLNLVMNNIATQGSAFGIHLLLASQNPRASNMRPAIYAQVTLRMALQMDQGTASSVLAEGNSDAVDLLDRPGKMIYNRNFGNKNYNEIGQVADISAEERYKALTHIQTVAEAKKYQRPELLVLFYGSKPTQLKDNRQLLQLIKMNSWLSLRELNKQVVKEPDWIVQESPSVFWLGEPMRIGNHTKGILRRRPRSNLLLVGNSEETIFGILSGILVSLIHCYQPQKAKFNIIDLSIEDQDNPWTEMTLNFRDTFDRFFPIKIAKRYGDNEAQILKAETLLKETFDEFERRLQLRNENPDLNPDQLGESLFFVYAIGGMNRAQNLRPVMGRKNEELSEDAQKIFQLISQGSELGIHTILWLEDMKAFTQKLALSNKQWLGNFDLRVALTMSGDDSRSLLGESDAEKLPRLRAYFNDESSSVGMDKFKPYAVPTKAEMLDYATNFNRRSQSADI